MTEKDAILAVLRWHTIGAYNGRQVLCAAPACRTWMTVDNWHQHVAARVARFTTRPAGGER